jgi:hypothetical protein
VLKQALQLQKQEGAAAVQMLQAAAQVQQAAEPGKGERVDVTA